MPRLRHSPGTTTEAPLSHMHVNTHRHTHTHMIQPPDCLETSPRSSFCPLPLISIQNSPISLVSSAPSISIPPPSEHSLIPPLLLLSSHHNRPFCFLSPTTPLLHPSVPPTGLKVLFITRAGDMALKNHPIIIFHPANSTHSHRDIITTPCHTREMEAADFQPGRVCHSVCMCESMCVCVCV